MFHNGFLEIVSDFLHYFSIFLHLSYGRALDIMMSVVNVDGPCELRNVTTLKAN